MKKAILAAWIAMTSAFPAQIKEAGKEDLPIPAHEIDRYEKAGPYELRRLADSTYRKEDIQRVERTRGWLWAHWMERRMAVLMETRYSIEGERSTFFYFLEPGPSGQWRIAIKIERILDSPTDAHCQRLEVQYFVASSLTRVEPGTDRNGHLVPVPENERRPPSDFLLLLKDRDGNELNTY